MKFNLHFNTKNKAFGDDVQSRNEEIKRILLKVISDLEKGTMCAAMYDSNTNMIGSYSLTE